MTMLEHLRSMPAPWGYVVAVFIGISVGALGGVVLTNMAWIALTNPVIKP